MTSRTYSPARLLALIGLSVVLMFVAVPATASAQLGRVRGVETTLEPTPAFNQLLSSSDFVLNVVSPAGPRPPVIAFPITSGRVRGSSTRFRGYVNHGGGVAIARSGVSLALTNFKFNFTRRPFVGARAGLNRVRFLNLSSVSVRTAGRRVAIVADAGLAKEAAIALNKAFSTTNFSTNQPVGTIRMEIRR